MFMALSEDDATVDSEDALEFFKKQGHPHSRLVLYTNRLGEKGDSRIQPRKSAYSDEGILTGISPVDFRESTVPAAV